MKRTAIAYFFAFLMILLASSIFLVSCKTKQLVPDVNKEVFVKKDSSSQVTTIDNSKAIIDSLRIYISDIKTTKPECDSITQVALQNLLQTLNTSKQSGDNSYEIKYNALLKRLDLIIKVGATKNEVSKGYQIKEISTDRFITKTITVKAPLPKWQLLLIIIGSAAIGFLFLKGLLMIRKYIPA